MRTLLESKHGDAFIWMTCIVLLFALLIGGIVGYHALDRAYMEHYVVGLETTVDNNWIQYYIDTDGMDCNTKVDSAGDSTGITIYCYP